MLVQAPTGLLDLLCYMAVPMCYICYIIYIVLRQRCGTEKSLKSCTRALKPTIYILVVSLLFHNYSGTFLIQPSAARPIMFPLPSASLPP